jgi:hypothetical protein
MEANELNNMSRKILLVNMHTVPGIDQQANYKIGAMKQQ